MPLWFLLFSGFWIGSSAQRLECVKERLDPEDPQNYCTMKKTLSPGTWCLVRPERLRPTQFYVGKVQTECTKREMESLDELDLHDLVFKEDVPVVVGPNNTLFLVDHHHFASALFQAFLDFEDPLLHRVLYACVQADYSRLPHPDFWPKMRSQNYAYLQDNFGRNITVDQLPETLKGLADNPYRTFAAWLRASNAFVKCGTKGTKKLPQCQENSAPFFLECFWANLMHSKYPLDTYPEFPVIKPSLPYWVYRANFQAQVQSLKSIFKDAIRFATGPQAKNLPGFNLAQDDFEPGQVELTKRGCVIKKKKLFEEPEDRFTREE